ncbi:hypothetical protein R1flu_017123 [Riccia fluitans]|uniref:Uncharacterized protein n=1 Tax=Riccia fluitans TaxID=41844 RepID=A0ABD1YSQ6_9MARC
MITLLNPLHRSPNQMYHRQTAVLRALPWETVRIQCVFKLSSPAQRAGLGPWLAGATAPIWFSAAWRRRKMRTGRRSAPSVKVNEDGKKEGERREEVLSERGLEEREKRKNQFLTSSVSRSVGRFLMVR